MVQPLNLFDAVDAGRPADEPLAWDSAVTRGKFRARVVAWADWFGATPDNAFALFQRDAVEFAAVLFGAWQARKTIFLPGDNLPVTCVELSRSVAGFLGDFPDPWHPLAGPPDDGASSCQHFAPVDAEFTGLVLYTSGSTGAPQPIAKNLAQMAAEVAHLEEQFGWLFGVAEIVTTVSHQHIYGLLFDVLWPLAAGRRIQARGLSWFDDLAAMLAEREAVLVSSPAHLARLGENSNWPAAAARLRAIFSSGGPLPFAAAQRCQSLTGRTPIEVYGSSETGGIAWRQQESVERQAWTALPGVEWRVVALGAADGRTAAEQILEVRSAHLPSGDWFGTADRARPVNAGSFLLGGRVDRIVKLEGKRVSLGAVENLLESSPLVVSARVILVEGRRQRLAAFVVPSEAGRWALEATGRRGLTRQLRAVLERAIEAVAIPRLWRYLDALPVNSQGKISYTELRALLEPRPGRLTEPQGRLVEHNDERALYELIAPPQLVYFDGHFDGQPILAGVVQVDWVIDYGRRSFTLPAHLRAIHALKFQRVIKPDTKMNLELVYRRADSTLSFTLSSALGVHASGRLLFAGGDV